MPLPDFDFDSLSELHNSVNELLHSPNTKLEIIHGGHREWAHQVSEASLRMADSCAAAKDLLLLARGHLQSLQSAFRRITETASAGNTFAPHRLPRKQLKKAILKRLHSLEGMRTTTYSAASPPPDESLAVVVELLKEVRSTTLLIVRSLFSLIALPNPDGKGKPESVRKDPVFMRIKLTRVDSLSFWEKCDVSDIREVAKKLEELETVVQELEAELEDMFRRLIRTRASLLNILTATWELEIIL